MALRRRVIPLLFEQGIDTKEDEKTLTPLKLATLENGVWRKRKKIQKRPGGKKLGTGVIGSSTVLSDADALGTFNDELLQFCKQSVYSHAPNADRSADKGAAVSVKVSLTDVVKNSYEQSQVDMAVFNNIALIGYEDSRGGVRAAVYDHSSGSTLLDDTLVSGSATRPRCVAFNGYLYLFYIVTNDLRARQINPVNPSPLGSEQVISSSVNSTNVHYDVTTQDGYIVVGYNVQGASQIRMHKLNDALAIQATVNIAESADNSLAVIRGPMSTNVIVWHNTSAAKVRAAAYDVSMVQTIAPLDIDATAGTVNRITGYALPDDTGTQLFYEYSAAATYNRFVRQNSLTKLGIAGTSAVFLRSVGIASKAWANSPDTTNRGFVGLVHDSVYQSTFFVARNDGFICAKLGAGIAGGTLSRTLPATVTQRETGVFVFGCLTKNTLVDFTETGFLSFRGLSIAELDFENLRNFSSSQLGDNLHVVGGILSMYDGQSVVEHGFHLWPEDISKSQTTGGSLTLLGTYSYQVCFEWTDARGQIHRSAPSNPLSVVLTGSNNRVQLTIPTLRLTAKHGTRTDAVIVVYRTESLGTVYYRCTSKTSPTYNDTTADSVVITDDLADSVLIANETLYTTGGILENAAAPSASLICVWGNRLVAVREDGTIQPSQERAVGAPVEWADELTIPLDPIGGRPTGIAAMDDKLIAFKESSIYYTAGEGPDATGAGTPFRIPVLIARDTGTVDSNSIVSTIFGLMFKSLKGIYLLTRDLQVVNIGAPVDSYNAETVTSAVNLTSFAEIRFTTLDGPALVMNYEDVTGFVDILDKARWSVFTNYSANDALTCRDVYHHIKRIPNDVAQVVQEVEGFFLDIDQKFSLKARTGPLSLAGIQGFQRLTRAMVLGEYKSAHKLRIRARADFNGVWTEEHLYDATADLDHGTYGSGSPYGSDTVYGGYPTTYQPRVHVVSQKCEALQLEIEDITQDGGSFESYSLTGLALEVGTKKGLWKQRPAATV